jgi:DNA-binding transcriptional LysR family regulator
MRYLDWVDSEDDRLRFVRNLDWNLLKVFSEIARSGGVTRAAEVMSRQQPAVSSALKRLEEQLGIVLCRRGPAGFELTDQGKLLSEICARFEADLKVLPEQFTEIASHFTAQIRVVTVGSISFEPLDSALADFARIYPYAEILINLAPWRELEALLLNEEAEFAVGPASQHDDGLSYTLLYREKNVPLCGPRHPLFGRTVSDPVALSSEPFVLLGDSEAEPVRQYRESLGWGQNCAAQSLDLNEVKRLVIAGTAIALLPREFLELDIASGGLWPLMDPPPDAEVDIYAITRAAGPKSQGEKVFLEFIENALEGRHLEVPEE